MIPAPGQSVSNDLIVIITLFKRSQKIGSLSPKLISTSHLHCELLVGRNYSV